MKKFITLLLLFAGVLGYSQPIYRTIESTILGQERDIKIQLPRNYKGNQEKSYPVFYVLDGDYLFEPFAGNVDYYSYWEDMPEAIVVGVNQVNLRDGDCHYDENNGFPVDGGADFFEFLGMELMPLIDNEYRTAKMSFAVGHDITANFINYYLFKENPLFRGYINISPHYAPDVEDMVLNALQNTEKKFWYYLCTSSADIDKLKKEIVAFDEKMKTLDKKNINYFYDNFENLNHYTMIGKAIPSSLISFFETYRPITQEDYDKIIDDEEITNYYQCLEDKYTDIKELYGLEINYRVNDILAVSNMIIEKEKWEQLKDLGKMVEKDKNYRDTMLGNYLSGLYYEKIGEPKKAKKEYEKAYVLEEIRFLNKDFMYNKMEEINKDFGE